MMKMDSAACRDNHPGIARLTRTEHRVSERPLDM